MITDLEIIQSTSTQEQIDMSTAHKLYQTAKDTVDNGGNVTLEGNLQATAMYENELSYLNGFQDLTISALTTYIVITDPEVKRLLLLNYGDSEGISTTDLTTITRLNPSGSFAYNNHTISTFNELGRFVNVRRIYENEFRGSYITSIDLSNIERIDSTAFRDSRLAGSISMPNLTTLDGAYNFANCNITAVTNLGSVTKLRGAMFYDCSNLVSVNLPSTCTELDQQTFYGCESLTTINLEHITKILGRECFVRCSNLETVNLSGPLSETSYDTFVNCPKLKNVTINLDNCSQVQRIFYACPLVDIVLYYKNATTTDTSYVYSNNGIKNAYFPKLTTINGSQYWYTNNTTNSAFGGNNGRKTVDMVYFKDITSFPAYTFSNTNLTLCVNNTQPPSLPVGTNGDAFHQCTITAIYVPDTAVSTYKNDSSWSAYSSYIQSMNNCTKYNTEADWITAGKPAGCLIQEYM